MHAHTFIDHKSQKDTIESEPFQYMNAIFSYVLLFFVFEFVAVIHLRVCSCFTLCIYLSLTSHALLFCHWFSISLFVGSWSLLTSSQLFYYMRALCMLKFCFHFSHTHVDSVRCQYHYYVLDILYVLKQLVSRFDCSPGIWSIVA